MDFVFYLTLFFLIFLFGTLYFSIDYDFWARLIVGKSFFQTGTLFQNDFYSYGTTHDFIDHEWGSSLIFYLIQDNFGDIGIQLLKAITIFLTLFLITKVIRLDNKDIKLHFLIFFFALHSIAETLFSTVRCQTFSFLFFFLFLYILKYAKNKNNYRVLWCLPVLNIIWANTHGGFVMGIALIGIFLVGEFLNDKTSKYNKYLFITLIATTLSCLINPYGFKYIYYIFEAFMLDRIHITEWQSGFFSEIYVHKFIKFKLFFASAIILFLYSIIKNIKRNGFKNFYTNIDKTKYLILLFCILISLKAVRCHIFFVYCTIALCYCDFYNIFNKKLPQKIDNIKEIMLLILITISTLSHIYTNKFQNIVLDKEYPIYCVEFIKQNNLKGNVFTMFHTGSYVAYKLYPNNHVFMDGRYEEVYDNNLINEMGEVFIGLNEEKFFEKYHSDILIIEKAYPIYKKLKEGNKNWFLAYESEFFALFLPEKLKDKKFIQPTKDKNYYNKTKFKTLIDWHKQL